MTKHDKKITKRLLSTGIVAGPLFIIVPTIEIFTRPGFSIDRHAISVLSLGDFGWVQIAAFIITGLMAIACAVGIRRTLQGNRGGTWGPLLIGAFGAGMIAAGIFTTDPGFGFPPGAPEGMPTSFSWHAMVHSLAFFVSFISLTISGFVFARRFASVKKKGWAIYCALIGITTPTLIMLGMSKAVSTGVAFFADGILVWIFVSLIALQLKQELNKQEGKI